VVIDLEQLPPKHPAPAQERQGSHPTPSSAGLTAAPKRCRCQFPPASQTPARTYFPSLPARAHVRSRPAKADVLPACAAGTNDPAPDSPAKVGATTANLRQASNHAFAKYAVEPGFGPPRRPDIFLSPERLEKQGLDDILGHVPRCDPGPNQHEQPAHFALSHVLIRFRQNRSLSIVLNGALTSSSLFDSAKRRYDCCILFAEDFNRQ